MSDRIIVLNDPINNIDPLGLFVAYAGPGGAGGIGGLGSQNGITNFSALHGGIYGETSLRGKREWGTYLSGGEGDIDGAALSPIGIIAGFSFGTIEDFEKASKAMGINFLGVTIEITYDPCNESILKGTGINFGFLGRGFGFGTYKIDTKTNHWTQNDNYTPLFPK